MDCCIYVFFDEALMMNSLKVNHTEYYPPWSQNIPLETNWLPIYLIKKNINTAYRILESYFFREKYIYIYIYCIDDIVCYICKELTNILGEAYIFNIESTEFGNCWLHFDAILMYNKQKTLNSKLSNPHKIDLVLYHFHAERLYIYIYIYYNSFQLIQNSIKTKQKKIICDSLFHITNTWVNQYQHVFLSRFYSRKTIILFCIFMYRCCISLCKILLTFNIIYIYIYI